MMKTHSNYSSIFILKCLGVYSLRMVSGMITHLLGLAMTDLTYYFRTSYEDISLASSLCSLGYILASLSTGLIFKKREIWINPWLTTASGVCVLAVCVAPFVVYVQLFWIIWSVIGFCLGAIHLVSLKIVINVRQTKITRYVQGYSFMATVGSVIGPIIVNPFLQINAEPTQDPANFNTTVLYTTAQTEVEVNTTQFTVTNPETTRVHFAFVAVALLSFCAYIPWIAYMIRLSLTSSGQDIHGVTEEEIPFIKTAALPVQEEDDARVCISRTRKFMLCGTVLFYSFFTYGLYSVQNSFIRSLSLDYHHVGRDTASLINATAMAACGVSIALACCLTRILSVLRVFLAFSVSQFVAIVFWACFTRQSVILHWIGVCVFAVSSVGGSNLVVVILKESLIGDVFLSYYSTAGSVGYLVFVWLAGRLYDQFGPDALYVLTLPLGICSIMSAITITVLTACFNN